MGMTGLFHGRFRTRHEAHTSPCVNKWLGRGWLEFLRAQAKQESVAEAQHPKKPSEARGMSGSHGDLDLWAPPWGGAIPTRKSWHGHSFHGSGKRSGPGSRVRCRLRVPEAPKETGVAAP